MLLMGTTINRTREGLDLLDGNSCLGTQDRILSAIAEERLTRVKYDADINKSFNYCLSTVGASVDDIDAVILSTCCDLPPDVEHATKWLHAQKINVPEDKLFVVPSHHLSHACSAFYTSSFQRALVVVADNEGSVIAEESGASYFESPLEKFSIYLGEHGSLRLVKRLFSGPGDLGLGNLYAYFTEYLGHESYQAAGKVTGLAPFGNVDRFSSIEVFEDLFGERVCKLEPLYNRRLSVRRLLLRSLGKDLGYPDASAVSDPAQFHMDLAAFVQAKLEDELLSAITCALEETGTEDVCLAGGVFLNCLVNGKIRSKVNRLHVVCAPGDSGQGLGNLLWYLNRDPHRGSEARFAFSGYSGQVYHEGAIEAAIEAVGEKVEFEKVPWPARAAAKDLSNHRIVFWFQGGSELGPRALGNRSILAHPGQPGVRDYLNSKVKRREWYRPFAPSILQHRALEVFGISDSPFMHIAMPVNPEWHNRIGEIVHTNRTSRVHTVSRSVNPQYYELIESFELETGIPLILNTSFNGPGEPIVESPKDAIRTYLNCGEGVLYLGNYRVVSKTCVKSVGVAAVASR